MAQRTIDLRDSPTKSPGPPRHPPKFGLPADLATTAPYQ